MSHVLITHEVEDYTVWKQGFDDAALLRKNAGEVEFQILKYEENPKIVVHFSRWRSLKAAKSFFESYEVERIREHLGVRRPQFVYLDQLEEGIL